MVVNQAFVKGTRVILRGSSLIAVFGLSPPHLIAVRLN